MAPHILYSIERYVTGVAAGVTVGIGVGLLMGWSQKVRNLLEPPLEVIRTIPPLAAIPFLIMWFGSGPITQFLMLAGYCFLMLVINTIEAIHNVSPVYLQFAATMGATRGQMYRKVVLPAIVPELVGGLRVALALSWGLEVVAELVGADLGIGKTMTLFLPLMMTDALIAGIIWVVLLAIGTDLLFVCVARRITAWVPMIE